MSMDNMVVFTFGLIFFFGGIISNKKGIIFLSLAPLILALFQLLKM